MNLKIVNAKEQRAKLLVTSFKEFLRILEVKLENVEFWNLKTLPKTRQVIVSFNWLEFFGRKCDENICSFNMQPRI